MTNTIFLANVLSHLEMRKALAHVKSQLLSREVITSAFIYNVLLKVFLCEKNCLKNSNWQKKKKSSYFTHCEVCQDTETPQKTHCVILVYHGSYLRNCASAFPRLKPDASISFHFLSCWNTEAGSTLASNTPTLQGLSKRISGAGFLLLSGIGTGSFGRRRSFLVIMGFTSIESVQ